MNAFDRQAVPEYSAQPRPPGQLDRSLPIALLRAREAIMTRFRPLLAEHGMTEQQWRVMRVLQEQSPLDASCVAARACVLAPSLTRMIKTLRDRRFVERMRDSGDARRSMLSITPEGLAFIEMLVPAALDIHDAIRSRYGAERMEILIDMLNDLADFEPAAHDRERAP